jgi:hypothetical protein
MTIHPHAPSSARRTTFVLLAMVSALAVPYCLAGYAMAGSFGASNPERHAYWWRVGSAYLAGAGLGVVLLVWSVVMLWRRR